MHCTFWCLLSNGGVHGHESHIHALLEMATQRGVKKLFLHAFLDGRGTSPKSAGTFIQNVHDTIQAPGGGRFASLIGRYQAMNRDRHWQRTRIAYDLISQGEADYWAHGPFIASGYGLCQRRNR